MKHFSVYWIVHLDKTHSVQSFTDLCIYHSKRIENNAVFDKERLSDGSPGIQWFQHICYVRDVVRHSICRLSKCTLLHLINILLHFDKHTLKSLKTRRTIWEFILVSISIFICHLSDHYILSRRAKNILRLILFCVLFLHISGIVCFWNFARAVKIYSSCY